jgi:ribose-phosphate pyrophosphokinase
MSIETGVTEVALPGFEPTGSVLPKSTQPRSEHWIERGPHKRLMLFSGRSNPDLAQKIAERLGIELGAVTLKTFANGETYCRYEESIRGADLFLVQTGCEPVDRNLIELLIMIQAAKLASAKRITVVIPWYPYSRQDKKSAPREPITGKLVADFLQVAGADRVLTMDLHAGQIQGFFGIPVDHMTALPIFAQHFRDLGLVGDNVVSVAPDAGRAKMGVKFAQMVEADFAIMHKTRPAHDVAAVTEVTGNVRGKVALVGDDVIMTGGTLLSGARALRVAGATGVYVFATHGIFAKGALERFGDVEELDGIVVTDTVPVDPLRRPEKLTVLTVSGLLAETIWNVFSDESVSAIFAGENQLF